MGVCTDASVTHLNALGYNVVRVPREGLAPLMLVGRQGGTTQLLGGLEGILVNAPATPPRITRDQQAAAISGQRSSKLKVGIGLNVLGGVIGALGGNLAVKSAFEKAGTLQFSYEDVRTDTTLPLDVGKYLRDGDVDDRSPLLKHYVMGNGQLFLVTETLKSCKLTVACGTKKGQEHEVDVPVVKEMVGGKIGVSAAGEKSSTVTFTGDRDLVFGFKAMLLGVRDGELGLLNAAPKGDLAMDAMDEGEPGPVLLESQALVGLTVGE